MKHSTLQLNILVDASLDLISGSAALRYRRGSKSSTLMVNPLMGHLALSFNAAISPQLTLATEYNFNTFSHYSDLGIGAKYSNGNHTLEACVDKNHGLTVKWTAFITSRFRAAFGIHSGLEQFHPNRGLGLEFCFE